MKKILSYFLCATLVLSYGCDFLDINDDPNKSKEVPKELLMPSAITGSVYNLGGYYHNLGSFWAQHYTQSTGGSQWANIDNLNIDENDFDDQWLNMYATSLQDCELLRKRCSSEKDWTYYLMATCVQSFGFQTLADLYDEIPFSEALRGSENETPRYEKGSDITDSLIRRLDVALSQDFELLSNTAPSKEDLIFQGDMDKWVQFANTLKLKIFLRWVNVDANKYSTEIQDLLAEDNFLDADASFTAFKNEVNGRNPFYETFIDRLPGNVVASNTLLGTMELSKDGRYMKIFNRAAANAKYAGLVQGRYLLAVATYPNYTYLSAPAIVPLNPVYFFTRSEVIFLKAEAEFRYGSAAKAEDLYRRGIDVSFEFYGLAPDPTLYAAGGAYEYKGLESIMTQKWMAAANCRPLEAFFDKNRTGYPTFFVAPAMSAWGNLLPQRLIFPRSERQRNPNTPVQKWVYEKVWWAL